MKLNRNYVTPFLSLIFCVVGISGLLILFHLFDGYTEVVHEILGLFFVICASFHIILNWKAQKIFSVLTLTVILIISEIMYPPVNSQLMERVVKAPIGDAFKALNIEYDKGKEKLQKIGISVDDALYFEDLWKRTNADAEEVIDLLLE
jgi:hypothetical protein